jgi:hypothetical protein
MTPYQTMVESVIALESERIWDCYNTLLLSPDRARLRKILIRYRLFESTLSVPGDVVECGVYKGTGLIFWAKLLDMFAPSSRKKVIGFDIFAPFSDVELLPEEQAIARAHDDIEGERTRAHIEELIFAAGLMKRVELVEGDVTLTAARYAASRFGSRISLLHLDLDTYAGTTAALESLWPLVSPGGILIFDEYGLPGMGESDAADEFFRNFSLRPLAVPFAETPTAFLVKP